MYTVIHACIDISSDICAIHAVYIGLLVAADKPDVLGINAEVN